jgi:hypothetical protein
VNAPQSSSERSFSRPIVATFSAAPAVRRFQWAGFAQAAAGSAAAAMGLFWLSQRVLGG